MPSGRSWAVNAAKATAWIGIALSGVPRTRNSPPANSRSSSAASSWWAAMARALSMHLVGGHVDGDAADRRASGEP